MAGDQKNENVFDFCQREWCLVWPNTGKGRTGKKQGMHCTYWKNAQTVVCLFVFMNEALSVLYPL